MINVGAFLLPGIKTKLTFYLSSKIILPAIEAAAKLDAINRIEKGIALIEKYGYQEVTDKDLYRIIEDINPITIETKSYTYDKLVTDLEELYWKEHRKEILARHNHGQIEWMCDAYTKIVEQTSYKPKYLSWYYLFALIFGKMPEDFDRRCSYTSYLPGIRYELREDIKQQIVETYFINHPESVAAYMHGLPLVPPKMDMDIGLDHYYYAKEAKKIREHA